MSAIDGYGPADYDAMLADAVRTPAYLAAIAQEIRDGDVVVEVGTGLGYFAVAACRAGARHVYAIEHTRSALLAEAIVRENGLSDRITCIRADANTVELPERANVLLFDLRGAIPWNGNAIPTIASVRQRLCTTDVRIIGRSDTVFAAPCAAPRHWKSVELALGETFRGISRQAASAVARSMIHAERVAADTLRSAGLPIATVDYRTVSSPDVDATLEWVIRDSGAVEGVALWFDADLADGVAFSTAPGLPHTVHNQGFLPFSRRLDATAGDRLTWRFRAKLIEGAYVFAWDTTLHPADPGVAPTALRQSTLTSVLAAPADIERRRATHVWVPADFAALSELMALVDGHRTLQDIAREIRSRQPARFSSEAAALAWVSSTLSTVTDRSAP